MKYLLPIILLATIGAQARVADPALRIAISERQSPHTSIARQADSNYSPVLIEATDDALAELENKGAVVLCRREQFAAVCIPAQQLTALSHTKGVKRAEANRISSLHMDKARQATNVDALHAGIEGVSLPLTGQGVVVGFSDIGFDPQHPAFGNRVAAVHIYDEYNARHNVWDQASGPTDTNAEFHATHVAGILAGGSDATPYNGVATGATIVATMCNLTDAAIISGVEDVIAAAKELGQPAVINLSIGSTLGPHDGTDIFTQYLDLCAEEAAIVMSAGNDGDGHVSIARTFTEESTSFTTMITDKYTWNGFNVIGGMDIWGHSTESVDIRFRVWDETDREYVYESGLYQGLTTEDILSLSSDNDADFAKFYNGKVYLADEVNEYNNRYNRYLAFRLTSTAKASGGWGRYHLIVEITGHPGQSIDVWEDGSTTELKRQGYEPDCITGDAITSISSIACGFNTICVGSCTTRTTAPLLSGGEKSWSGYEAGTTTATSSYGNTYDGRSLPHFCAPGAYIVSATSSYYLKAHPDELKNMVAQGPSGEYYHAECGTSMSSPHAAGIFALWLEADPTLTPADLRRIAMATASASGCNPADPRTGAGVIDAEAGLKMVLDEAGIAMPMEQRIMVSRRNGRLVVDVPEGIPYSATVYDMTGRQIGSQSLPQSPVIAVVKTASATVVKKL